MKLVKTVKKGFTLVELVIVMAVIALILSVAIPNFRAMQQEGQLTKSEGDLNTLKVAVTSYWKNNSQAYPADVAATLTGAVPQVISKALADPWKTDTTNATYGYISGTDTTFGDYFIIYTQGPGADTTPAWDKTNKQVNYSGSGRVVSNAPLNKS